MSSNRHSRGESWAGNWGQGRDAVCRECVQPAIFLEANNPSTLVVRAMPKISAEKRTDEIDDSERVIEVFHRIEPALLTTIK
jgi:hypothetical protein